MKSDRADILRLKHKYRRLILSGKLKLPHGDAVKLLGPDCAYHLYSVTNGKEDQRKRTSQGSRIRSAKSRKKAKV